MVNPNDSILVCFAVRQEAKFLPRARVPVLITGIGRQNAARAVTGALDRLSPRLVLSCGFAGGLDPALPAGAVVFSVDADAGLAPELLAAGARPARFHCAARVVTSAAEKQRLHAETGTDAVEMESGAISEVCRARGIPSVTVRAISDPADEDLPLDFNALMTAEHKVSYGRLCRALLRSPGSLPGLLRLQRQTETAARNLAKVLACILHPRLYQSRKQLPLQELLQRLTGTGAGNIRPEG